MVLWLALIVVAGIYVVARQRDELAETWRLIRHADPWWIGVILALEVVSFVTMAGVYGMVLAQLGHRVTLLLMVRLHLQRVVISGLTPFGGPTSALVVIHRLRQRGIPVQDSLLATFIKSATGHIAFLLILIPALFVRRPTAIMLFGTVGLLLMVAAMLTIIVWIVQGRRLPTWVFRFTPRRLLRVLVQLRQHTITPIRLLPSLGVLVLFRLSGIVTLWAALRAVGWESGPIEPLTAYAVGAVLYGLTPFFQGLGVVEVGTALALERLGVPVPMAIGATLIARVLGLWLPMAIGVVAQFVEALWRRRYPVPNGS